MQNLNKHDRKKMRQIRGCRWGLFNCFRLFGSSRETDSNEGSYQPQLSPQLEAVNALHPTFLFVSPRRNVPQNQDISEALGDVTEQAKDDSSDEIEEAFQAVLKLKVHLTPCLKTSSSPSTPRSEDRSTRSLQQVSQSQPALQFNKEVKDDRRVHFPIDLPSISANPYDIPNTSANEAAGHNRDTTVAISHYQEAGLLIGPVTLPPTITNIEAEVSPSTQLTPPAVSITDTTSMQLHRTGAFRQKQAPRTPTAARKLSTQLANTITEQLPLPPAITVIEQQSATLVPPTPPDVTVDNKQAAQPKPTSNGSRGILNKTFQRLSFARITKTPKWLKKQYEAIALLVAGSSPDIICQETDNDISDTTRESNEILKLVAQYKFREQAQKHLEPVFRKVSPGCVRSYTVDDLLADRNEPPRLRKTRSAQALLNGQEIILKSQPIWPSLDHLVLGLGPDGQLNGDVYQRAWADWWNWRSQLYSIPYSNTIESPNNYTRDENKNYVNGKFVKQLGDVGGKKRVVTTTRADSHVSFSTFNKTSAFLSTSSLPSISTLPSTGELPWISTLPSTGELPSLGELPSTGEPLMPSTSALPTTSAGPTTSTDETAHPKSIKGKSGKHPAKGTKRQNQNLSEKRPV